MLKIEFRAMGCQMAAILDSDEVDAVQALEEVPVWFEEWEQVLSRFRPDSELNLLNSMNGSTCKVSKILWDALKVSLEAAEWSGGLVNPAVLNSLEWAGYDRSFDQIRTGWMGSQIMVLDQPDEITEAWREIELNASNRQVHLPRGMKIDLGGSAKGWAASQAVERLAQFGAALVDAGGDIAISGPTASGEPWTVDIADPLRMQDNLGLLDVRVGGVATSGIDYRRWMKDGAWKHHIIDPRTGLPAVTDLLSVTVIAPNLQMAETAAKTVMILGSQSGLAWLEGQAEVFGLLALHDGQLVISRGMQKFLRRE